MSNKPVQFKRQKKAVEPRPVDVDGESFLFAPACGTRALEVLGDGESASRLFAFLEMLILDDEDTEKGTAYRRFVDLDLEMSDLRDFMGVVAEMYGLSEGESLASSTSSDDDGASSSPTSNGSTSSTSTLALTTT